MNHIITDNKELIEVLIEKGITLVCDDQMRMTLSDEDAERLPAIVEEFAPAASDDYIVETITYIVKWGETESLNPALKSQGLEREMTCSTIEEAREVYEEELEETDYMKTDDLDFEPSDKEWSSQVTRLSIYQVCGLNVEEIESSENYWLEL